LSFLTARRCFGVWQWKSNVFVLISDQPLSWLQGCPIIAIAIQNLLKSSILVTFSTFRINKRGSQKDAEQKKSGNYFFYDDGIETDEAEENFDDI
jgi:hypothetical protein